MYGRRLDTRGGMPPRRVGRPAHTWEFRLITDGLARLEAPGGEAVTLEHCLSRGEWAPMVRALTRRRIPTT